MSGNVLKIDAFTPFDPKDGYIVDSNDYNSDARSQKVELFLKNPEHVNLAKAPVAIAIEGSGNLPKDTLASSQADLAHNLRVIISVPREKEKDGGPLATPENDEGYDEDFLSEGLELRLPSNPEKLSQIRARFVLAEENPEEPQRDLK